MGIGFQKDLEVAVAVDVGALEIVEVKGAVPVFPALALLMHTRVLAVYQELEWRGDVVFVVHYDFRHVVRVEAFHFVKEHGAVPQFKGGLRSAEDHSAVAQKIAEAVIAPKRVLKAVEDVGRAVWAHDVKPALEFYFAAAAVVQNKDVVGEEEILTPHAVLYLLSVDLKPLDAQLPVAARDDPTSRRVRDLIVHGPAFGVEGHFHLAAVGQRFPAFVDDVVGGQEIYWIGDEPAVGLDGVEPHVHLVVNDVVALGKILRYGGLVGQLARYGAYVDGIDGVVINEAVVQLRILFLGEGVAELPFARGVFDDGLVLVLVVPGVLFDVEGQFGVHSDFRAFPHVVADKLGAPAD